MVTIQTLEEKWPSGLFFLRDRLLATRVSLIVTIDNQARERNNL